MEEVKVKVGIVNEKLISDKEPKTKRHKRQPIALPPKTGRNEPCPCGSGKKYKRCHMGKSLGE
jgi:uncharacterized protein YecA (UPF0149 family)